MQPVLHGNAGICNSSCTAWKFRNCNISCLYHMEMQEFAIHPVPHDMQDSAIHSLPYGNGLPVSKVPTHFPITQLRKKRKFVVLSHKLHTTQKFCNLHTHILITQSELNDLVWSSPRTTLGFWVPGCNSGISWPIIIEFLFFRTVKNFLSHSFTKRVIFLLAWHFWYGNPQNELQRR